MAPHNRRVRFRTPEVSSLVKAFEELELIGVNLKTSDDGQTKDIEALKPAISKLRSSSHSDGPLSALLDPLRRCGRKQQEDDDETLWQSLLSENIAVETIVELIQVLADSETSQLAMVAAEIYFSLMLIPGAFMYHVYNALVFRTCITVLKKWISSVGGS